MFNSLVKHNLIDHGVLYMHHGKKKGHRTRIHFVFLLYVTFLILLLFNQILWDNVVYFVSYSLPLGRNVIKVVCLSVSVYAQYQLKYHAITLCTSTSLIPPCIK